MNQRNERKVFKDAKLCWSMEARIEEALAGLNQNLENIRALLAWRDLEEAEKRRHNLDTFVLATSTVEQLKLEAGVFLKTYFDMQDALKGLPPSVKRPTQRRLGKIYAKFRMLPLPEGLAVG